MYNGAVSSSGPQAIAYHCLIVSPPLVPQGLFLGPFFFLHIKDIVSAVFGWDLSLPINILGKIWICLLLKLILLNTGYSSESQCWTDSIADCIVTEMQSNSIICINMTDRYKLIKINKCKKIINWKLAL